MKYMVRLGVLALIPLAMPVAAQAEQYGVDAHVGTLGGGLSFEYGLSENVDARVGFNKFTKDAEFEDEGLEYKAELELESGHALLDWHPFGGYFRVTGGLMLNNNGFTGRGIVDGGEEIGDQVVPEDESGAIDANISFDDAAPYLGIGWASSVRRADGLSFNLDIGLLSQGSANVDLSESEDISSVDQSDIEREEREIENGLSDFDTYPVIQFGVNYRF